MTSMNLHPEELIERAASGELSIAERERLDAHLRHCPSCRLEIRARRDFERLADREEVDVRALIANALLPERASAPRKPPRPRAARLRVALLAAALLGLGGIAAAASAWLVWTRGGGSTEPATVVVSKAASSRAPLARASGEPSPPTSIDSDTPAASTPVAKALDFLAPSVPHSPERAKTSPAPVAPALAASPEDAASLFDAANTARRRGDHEAAAAAYRRLIGQYPGSTEARESWAVLGRMLLDDGDASGALQSFDAYVQRGGALTAEAMLGKALALKQLGRTDDERAAWTALVDAFPDSVHAERARNRLAELGR